VLEPWTAEFALNQCQVTHTPGASLLMASSEQLVRNDHHIELDGGQAAPPASSLQAPLAPITSVTFTSHTPLNLNIAAATLEDLADTVNELRKSMRAETAAWKRTVTVPKYRIENHTDLAMDVFREDRSQHEMMVGAAAAAAGVVPAVALESMHVLRTVTRSWTSAIQSARLSALCVCSCCLLTLAFLRCPFPSRARCRQSMC